MLNVQLLVYLGVMDIEQDIRNLLQLQLEEENENENENKNGLEPSIEEQIPKSGE